MAPADESAYFPSLDRCLNGDSQLLSWSNIFTELAEGRPTLNKTVAHYLNDDQCIRTLSGAFDNPPSPTSQTRATFDTYTSAINVTPTSNGRYDINQIKDDALWLSKESKIDEVSALRLTVLEWQSRPTTRFLQSDPGEARPHILDRSSAGLTSSLLQSKRLSTRAINSTNENGTQDPTRARQTRLLRLYLTERQYLLKALEMIITRTMIIRSSEARVSQASKVELLGTSILRDWNLAAVRSHSGNHLIIDVVKSLEFKLRNLETGSGWSKEDGLEDELELLWIHTHILETIHSMQTILIMTSCFTELVRSEVILVWFRLANRVNFFASFNLPYPDMNELYPPILMSLVALVSLSLIQAPLALQSLQSMSSLVISGNEISDQSPYLQNIQCIEEITQHLLKACRANIETASLAIFAWGTILDNIRSYASSSVEVKEIRQSQRAIDNFGSSHHSDNDNGEESPSRGRPPSQRRSSFGSDTSQQTTFLEDVYEMIRNLEPNEDVILFLAMSAVDKLGMLDYMQQLAISFCASFGPDGTGLKMRTLLLDLARIALVNFEYQPEIITTIISIISGGEDYWTIRDRPSEFLAVDPASAFLRDKFLMQKVFESSLARFPYESLPFLQLCRALTSAKNGQSRLMEILQCLGTLTTSLSEQDAAYELIGEGDGIHVELTKPLDALLVGLRSLQEKPKLLSDPSSGEALQLMPAFQLPIGTVGRSLRDRKPLIVLWEYQYSGLEYMGRVLQLVLDERSKPHFSSTQDVFEVATEIVAILTSLLKRPDSHSLSANNESASLELAYRVLEEASNGLDRNTDVVMLILDLFEGELYRDQSSMSDRSSSEFILQSMHFIHSLLAILPNRVWPFLSRSGLLGLHDSESRLAAIVAVSELASGRYELLLSSIRLFEALAEDALANKVSRKVLSASLTKFGPSNTELNGTGITESAMKKIILQFEKVMVDVFESSYSWRFVLNEERLEINLRICRLFDRILSLCHENDDELELSNKLTCCFAPAAEYLSDIFLSGNVNDVTVHILTRLLVESLNTPCNTLSVRLFKLWQSQTIAALNLNIRLLQVNHYLGRPPSRLAQHLFDLAPALAAAYATCENYRLPVIQLFDVLVRTTDKISGQPPSLLGQLGQTTAKDFLEMLSVFDKPYDQPTLSNSIWSFFSGIVSHRQQWFATYLLTGSTPKEFLRSRDPQSSMTSSRIRPVLRTALVKLSNVVRLSLEEASSVLEFTSLAADFWPWVIDEIERDSPCTEACVRFLTDLRPSLARESGTSETEPLRLQAAAYIVNIVAMLVHRSNDEGNADFAKHVLSGLDYLLDKGVSVSPYNTSLHSSLRKNFESTFPGCKVSNFKRTALRPAQLGKYFYYDINLADQMLPHDGVAWSSNLERGFGKELVRANLNLSLVEARVNLFHSWKSLASELGEALSTDRNFQRSLAMITGNCLKSNRESTLPELVFNKLAQSRADLGFLLLQQLIQVARTGPGARGVLKQAWETLHSHAADLGTALTGDDAEYSRTLLKILYLSLQAHLDPSPAADSRAEEREVVKIKMMILEILSVVVARGFRSLTTRLHENPSKVLPADFALINAILRTALHIPGTDKYSEQLVTFFSDENTTRYASTLLSWSHQLTIDGDPVFGEFSITFLLELSTVPALAESMVIGGCLAQIASANLVKYFRRSGGIGPFDQPDRMYLIWTRGILPLVINLLRAIGGPIASEIASFLNQFKPQLTRASNSFDVKPSPTPKDVHRGYVNLAMASEIRSLALIATILDMFREAGASAGIVAADVAQLDWDRVTVKEDLDGRLQRRNALRDSIIAMDEREETWSRQKPTNLQGGSESRLEERIVEEMAAALSILEDEE